MKWTRILGIVGLGLGVATPAFAQDAPEPSSDTPEPADAAKKDAPPPAADDEAAPAASNGEAGKFVLGLRLGYGVALGSAAKDDKMSDSTSGQIPIWLDLGYMVTPNLMLGLYGQYGFASTAGSLKTLCDQGAAAGGSCSLSDLRFGIQGQFHLSPTGKIDPWLGLGVGYEMLKVSFSGGGQDSSVTDKGFELANLQGGADFKLMPNFGLGPFLSFSLGQYSSTSASGSLAAFSTGGDIQNKAIHEWLTFGVRGAFTL